MILLLAFLAAFGCALFNGAAAILEKVGVGKEQPVTSSHPGLLWKLRNNPPYLIGIVLDLLAWLLTLFAVHNLPLFVVEPIIACSVIVTVLIEYFLFSYRLSLKFLAYLLAIVVGLVLLTIVATPERATTISYATRWAIILTLLILAVIGSLFCTIQKRYATFIIAAISGLAFGGVAIAGRAIVFSHPYFHLIYNPLLWVIAGYGLLGILFFTIALQRASATVVNATMIACETLFPIFIGLIFLGDHPRDNLWALVALGITFTFSGTILIAISS